MSKNLIVRTTVAVSAAVLLSAPPLRAAPLHALSASGSGGAIQALAGMMTRLNLTDTQKAQIRAIFKANEDELFALAAAERAARTNLLAAIHLPAVDTSAVRQASAVVARVDSDLAVERAQIYSQVYAVLTPEQRTELQSGIADLHERVRSRIDAIISLFRSAL
jgi:Spy/CpxP family protein refolding chaperone